MFFLLHSFVDLLEDIKITHLGSDKIHWDDILKNVWKNYNIYFKIFKKYFKIKQNEPIYKLMMIVNSELRIMNPVL